MGVPGQREGRRWGVTSGRGPLGGPARAVRATPCPRIWSSHHGPWGRAQPRRGKQQGGSGWMARARLVKPRWGLGGEGSAPRHWPLLRRRLERGRRWAARRPRVLGTDGWVSSRRALRETWRAPRPTGKGGRPRRCPGRQVVLAPGVQRSERRRVGTTERRRVDGTPARVEPRRRRSHGDGGIHTADRERRTATVRARLAPLARRCRARARQPLTRYAGLCVVGTVSHVCTPHERLSQAQKTTPAMAAGRTDHGWTRHALLAFHGPLSRWAPPKRRGRPARALPHLIERWCS
jgi:hypothetical protein